MGSAISRLAREAAQSDDDGLVAVCVVIAIVLAVLWVWLKSRRG